MTEKWGSSVNEKNLKGNTAKINKSWKNKKSKKTCKNKGIHS